MKFKKYIKNIVAIIIGSPFVILVSIFFILLSLIQLVVWSSLRVLDILAGIDVE